MQKIYINLIIFFIICSNLFGQWDILNEGRNGGISSASFINETAGWIVGGGGLLSVTHDGGLTWRSIPMKKEWNISKIDFINESEGWAIGRLDDLQREVILFTEDGGYNWIVQKQQENFSFIDLQVLTADVIYVCTATSIIKSEDGGTEWIDISPDSVDGYYSSLRFLNPNEGMVAGFVSGTGPGRGLICSTEDAGKTWEKSILDDFSDINNLQFDNENDGYFIARNWTVSNEYYFCRTSDLGQTWEEIYADDLLIDSYYVLDNDTYYMSVLDSLNNVNLLKTISSGAQWEEIYSLTNWGFPIMNFGMDGTGNLICRNLADFGGSNFLILSNHDNQNNWLIRDFSYPLSDVFFLDQRRGFIVGGYQIFHGPIGGDILSTNDQGQTWSPHESIPGWINKIEYINDSTGYLITRDWPFFIAKTIDSGNDWQIVYENNFDSTGFDFYGHDMVTSSTGEVWAVGYFYSLDSNGGAILKSSDEGLTWDLIWTYLNTEYERYNLRSVVKVDDIIWAVGENGFIVQITEENSGKIYSYETDLPLNEVFFSDSNHGWIAGGYGYWQEFQSLLLKTVDGGETWTENEEFPYVINDFFFRDSLQGWAVGFDRNLEGVIVSTNNGGESWHLQKDGLPAVLNAVHFLGEYGWAVGDLGQVLKTENGGVSWINDDPQSQQISTFRLEQNYPNPFNQKTIINYELPITNTVELSIYNLLGQKVVNLLSEKQPAGRYQVEWDATGYASGVYFYRLSAEGKAHSLVQAKKLILLR